MQAAQVDYHRSASRTTAGQLPGSVLTRTRLEQLQTYRSDCVRAVSDCPRPVHVVSVSRQQSLELPCRSRSCGYCYQRYWLPRVTARIMSGLRGKRRDGDVLMLTVTGPGEDEIWDAERARGWNETAQSRFRLVLAAVQHRFGRLPYFRVIEFQKRGVIHYHVALRRIRFIPHAWMTRICAEHGFGFCWLSAERAEKRGAPSRYLTKYLSSLYLRDLASGVHVYSMSRSWCIDWRPDIKRSERSDWAFVMSALDAFEGLYGKVPLPPPDEEE